MENRIKQIVREEGIPLVGIAGAGSYPEMSYFARWLRAGYAAGMHYMARRKSERLNISRLLPGVRSVIVCGWPYNTRRERSIDQADPRRGWISRYAWGEDYHSVFRKKLREVDSKLHQILHREFESRIFVDTGPVLERVFAYRAGLGWFGKNSCLLHPQWGSYFFLGVILTTLELRADRPLPDRCGTCRRCLEACPTGALVVPKLLDSRLCISYQTIENRGEIPQELVPRLGRNLFGCDICQEVCPWNQKAPLTEEPAFQPRNGFLAPRLDRFFLQVLQEYPAAFKNSPLKRAKQKGLLRNTVIAIGNSPAQNGHKLLSEKRFTDEGLEKLRRSVLQTFRRPRQPDV